ncbi:MAG: BolA family protein [Geminicoccaceae bacterium]
MSVINEIKTRLNVAFAPSFLEVIDESAKHAGHVGARPEGETHFAVSITAQAFAGQSRLARQRMVMAELEPLMRTRIHALQLKANAPDDQP